MSDDEQTSQKPKTFRRKLLMIFTIAVLVIAAAGFLTIKNRHVEVKTVSQVTKAVAAHLVLPANEEPALLTVTDTSKLTTPFLKESEINDKILIYQKAQRVIIYRPSIDRIIDVGPVSLVPLEK